MDKQLSPTLPEDIVSLLAQTPTVERVLKLQARLLDPQRTLEFWRSASGQDVGQLRAWVRRNQAYAVGTWIRRLQPWCVFVTLAGTAWGYQVVARIIAALTRGEPELQATVNAVAGYLPGGMTTMLALATLGLVLNATDWVADALDDVLAPRLGQWLGYADIRTVLHALAPVPGYHLRMGFGVMEHADANTYVADVKAQRPLVFQDMAIVESINQRNEWSIFAIKPARAPAAGAAIASTSGA